MRKHFTENGKFGQMADTDDKFHDDPTLNAAIRTLRELPKENDLAIDRILSAVRAEKAADVIPHTSPVQRRSYWRQSTAAAVAAAALFGIGFVTGYGKRITLPSDSVAPIDRIAASETGEAATASHDMWTHGVDTLLAVQGRLASQNAQGVNVARPSIPILMQFSMAAPEAKQVSLVGDFNGWDPGMTPLHKSKDGNWVGTATLLPGHHTYAYMIDGVIVPDPNAVNVRDRDYDVVVSTIVVKDME